MSVTHLGSTLLALLAAGSLSACGTGQPAPSAPAAVAVDTGPASAPAALPTTVDGLLRAVTAKTSGDWTAMVTGYSAVGAARVTTRGWAKHDDQGLLLQANGAVWTNPRHIVESAVAVLHDVTYLRLPPGSGVAAAKPWVKVPTRTTDHRFAPLLGQLVDNGDPRQALGYLRAAVRITGHRADIVDNQPATRFDLTVDVAKLAADQHNGLAADPAGALHAAGVQTVAVSLWLDGGAEPVKITINTGVPAVGRVAVELNITQWGEPVQVAPPSEDQVSRIPNG